MNLVVGCDLEEFKEYAKRKGVQADLEVLEKLLLPQDASSLIVFREGNEIIGHAMWHEANTEEHRRGDPRDKEDKEILERLLGGKEEFVELHELWLTEEYRGKGYGERFFEFFEGFIRSKGYDSIIYYAFHPAALAVCRKRGYKEDYLAKEAWYVFYLPLKMEKKS
jgi:GNAT superfamily N-acetyltransferase